MSQQLKSAIQRFLTFVVMGVVVALAASGWTFPTTFKAWAAIVGASVIAGLDKFFPGWANDAPKPPAGLGSNIAIK